MGTGRNSLKEKHKKKIEKQRNIETQKHKKTEKKKIEKQRNIEICERQVRQQKRQSLETVRHRETEKKHRNLKKP